MICPVASLPCACICSPERREACAAEIVERAAIIEHDGKASREDAERLAGDRQVVIALARQPGQRRLPVR